MDKHQKLDSILKYMSENIGEIPKKPDRIVEKGLITKSLSDIETMIMDFESPNISVINETILELNEELMSACCTVSDGHYEATYCDDRGNYRRACRKARRALKQALREEAAISAH